jgi:hypothetical protein
MQTQSDSKPEQTKVCSQTISSSYIYSTYLYTLGINMLTDQQAFPRSAILTLISQTSWTGSGWFTNCLASGHDATRRNGFPAQNLNNV